MHEAIEQLRALNMGVPKPPRLPTIDEVDSIENKLGISFHPDLKKYLLEASDVFVGHLEPITVTEPESHTHILNVLEDARDMGVPEELFPFCEDNSDFYCLNNKGEVVFWSHDGTTDEKWPNLANWVEEVWIGGN